MPRVGFEPAILVFDQTKAVHYLDRVAAAIGTVSLNNHYTHDQLFLTINIQIGKTATQSAEPIPI
jgi:hypothetical protein